MRYLWFTVFTLLILAYDQYAYAARCIPADDSMEYYLKEPRHDLESSDLVAKVAIERSFLNVERSDGSIGSERTIYVAKVLSLWKGPLNPFIELTNAAPGARDFELGKQYLLFARLADDELYFAHWCGGTVDAVYASFKQSKLGTPSYDVQ